MNELFGFCDKNGVFATHSVTDSVLMPSPESAIEFVN
jgi:hypothetical protein